MNFEKLAVSKMCILSCQVLRESLNMGYGFCIRKRGSYVDFFFVCLGVRMVTGNRNMAVYFSNRGNKEHGFSLLGTSPAVKAVQGKLYHFSLSWLKKAGYFSHVLVSF